MAGRAGDELEELSLVELRAELGRRVDEAYHRNTVIGIKRHSRRVAVLLSAELWDDMQDRLRHPAPPPAGDPAADTAA
jgi:prevent-host-death family protein